MRGRFVNDEIAESDQTYYVRGADGSLVEERRLVLRFVLPDAASLLGMAADAGLRAQALFGDYDESPYVAGTSPFIIAALCRA